MAMYVCACAIVVACACACMHDIYIYKKEKVQKSKMLVLCPPLLLTWFEEFRERGKRVNVREKSEKTWDKKLGARRRRSKGKKKKKKKKKPQVHLFLCIQENNACVTICKEQCMISGKWKEYER